MDDQAQREQSAPSKAPEIQAAANAEVAKIEADLTHAALPPAPPVDPERARRTLFDLISCTSAKSEEKRIISAWILLGQVAPESFPVLAPLLGIDSTELRLLIATDDRFSGPESFVAGLPGKQHRYAGVRLSAINALRKSDHPEAKKILEAVVKHDPNQHARSEALQILNPNIKTASSPKSRHE